MKEKLIRFLVKVKHKLIKPDLHKEIFSNIYVHKKWGSDNVSIFYSGSGSDDENSAAYIKVISDFIKSNNIGSVVDLGCGDFRIGRKITNINKISYTGVDVVKELVNYNNKEFKNNNIRFFYRNIVKDKLPDGELCLIRQVLQHLSNSDIEAILKKCKKYKYLIITEHLPTTLTNEPNIDKQPDAGIRYYSGSGVYLDKPPYNKKLEELLTVFPEDHPASRIVTYQVFI